MEQNGMSFKLPCDKAPQLKLESKKRESLITSHLWAQRNADFDETSLKN